VTEHRADLVWAALTLGQAWIAAGRPEGTRTLGMFERWAGVLGGILDVAGIAGFLGNAEEFYAESDVESEAWRALIERWWDCYGARAAKVSDLYTLVSPSSGHDPIPLPIGDGSERSQKTRLGILLGQVRDRVYAVTDRRLRIERAGHAHNASCYRLVDVTPIGPTEPTHRTDANGRPAAEESSAYARAREDAWLDL
jgi:hypothetical protein